MRVGDFSVEVIAADGSAREVNTGHVLARPGQVYTLRLRNHSPLRAVADISIDGHSVTGGGLVLNPLSTVDLERPIHATERGRFTVIAEGNEQVFGPDGGRDNPDLGLIEARFRRELPQSRHQPLADPLPPGFPRPSQYPTGPAPEIDVSRFSRERRFGMFFDASGEPSGPLGDGFSGGINALMGAAQAPVTEPLAPKRTGLSEWEHPDAIERAAGTGLTGSSDQEFVTVHVGTLEAEATVIKLRIVIGTEEALSAPRPLPHANDTPARPAARP